MNVLSVCSGVGGLDRGLEAAGMTPVGFCELDPKARSVLARHWPDVPIHDDLTTLDGSAWHGRVDLVAGGTPCTDLSVAGRRAGLDGEHSRIFWDFCRVADTSAARWVLWENVAGALSSNGGDDFASVLWGLTGHRPAVPEDGWRSIGVCVGPHRTAVWRLLDARWFGVAQRRRRVFVVAGAPSVCAASVLVESESVPRGARPGSAAGQDVAALTANGVGAGGGVDDNAAQGGHIVEAYQCQGSNVGPAGTLRAGNGHLTGGVPFLLAAVSENQRGELRLTPYARQITTGGGKPGQGHPDVLAAFDSTWSGRYPISDDDLSPTLKVGSTLGIASPPAVAYPLAMRGRDDGVECEVGEPDTYNALRAGNGGSSRQNGVLTPDLAVRRLTPVECERLMSWPDDWTRWAADGTEIADSHRYRFAGNGVVSNCTQWIGARIVAAHQAVPA